MVETLGVKLVRLVTGEDIIAFIAVDDDGDIYLDEPLKMFMKRDAEGKSMILTPWLPLEVIAKNQTVLSPKDILAVIDVKDSTEEYYNRCVDAINEFLANPQETVKETVSPKTPSRTVH